MRRMFSMFLVLSLLMALVVSVSGVSAVSASTHKQQASKSNKKCKHKGKKHRCKKSHRSIVVQVIPPISESSPPCQALIRNGKLISSNGNCALAVENDTAEPVTVNPCIFVEGQCSVTQVCAKSAWHNADECLLSDYPVAHIEHLGYEQICVGVQNRRIYPPQVFDVQFRASKGSFSGPSEEPEYAGGLNRTYVCNETYTPPCPSAEGETDLVWAFVYDIETGLYTEAEAVSIEIPSSEVCAE